MLKNIARILVSVALLGYLIGNLDVLAITRYLSEADPWALVGAAVFTLCAVMARAYRWALILSAYGIRLRFGKSFRLTQAGNFFGQFLPSTIGGDAIRTWMASREGLPLKAVIHSVLLDRLFGVFALLLLIAFGLPALAGLGVQPAATASLAIASAAGLFAVASTLAIDRLLRGFRRSSLVDRVCEFSVDVRRLTLNLSASLMGLFASVCIHCFSIGTVMLLAYGVGAHLNHVQALALVPPVLLLAMLPFSLSGWGVREGAMMYALSYAGVEPEQAVAISILMGGVLLLVSLPGGFPVLDVRFRTFRTKE